MKGNTEKTSSKRKAIRIGLLVLSLLLLAGAVGVSAKYIMEKKVPGGTIPATAKPVIFTAGLSTRATVEENEEFIVSVSVEGSYQVHALEIELDYNKEKIDFVPDSVTIGEVFASMQGSDEAMVGKSPTRPKMSVISASETFSCEGEVFTAKFVAKEAGTYDITPKVDKFSFVKLDSTGERTDIDYEVRALNIEIAEASGPNENNSDNKPDLTTEEPTEEPTPEPTEEPTEEPEPEDTPEPTGEPEPEDTPEPTSEPGSDSNE